MSTLISFTERELLRGKVVPPAWYRMRIESIGEAPSKDQGSTNYPVEGIIEFDAATGDKEHAGVPIAWNFNSKALGFAVGFFESLGQKVEPGVRLDLKGAEGKSLDVFVENGEWQGRILNRVNHKYRAIQS